MKAKAKAPHRTIRAFTGREFVWYEWRPVPEEAGEEAARLEAGGYLELLPDPPAPAAVVVDYDATEAAAKLAADFDLDLGAVTGSGAGGRILKSDVWDALEDEEE